MVKQTLKVLSEEFCIHSLDAKAAIPNLVFSYPVYFIGKTEDELSIVVPTSANIESEISDPNWKVLEVLGPLDLSMVGIMAKIGNVLAEAKVSIFVVSTFETDYFLVKHSDLVNAIRALTNDGYKVIP